jgi:hypothetical protein
MCAVCDRHRLSLKGITDFEEQLGCPLGKEPQAGHLALYAQLLVGFDLIARGDTYPGYAMVFNEGMTDVEADLISANLPGVIASLKRYHHYWRTAVMEAMSRARRRHVVMSFRLSWVRDIDPVLSSAMGQIGQHLFSFDCVAMALHWLAEQEAGKALEHGSALSGPDLSNVMKMSSLAG